MIFHQLQNDVFDNQKRKRYFNDILSNDHSSDDLMNFRISMIYQIVKFILHELFFKIIYSETIRNNDNIFQIWICLCKDKGQRQERKE